VCSRIASSGSSGFRLPQQWFPLVAKLENLTMQMTRQHLLVSLLYHHLTAFTQCLYFFVKLKKNEDFFCLSGASASDAVTRCHRKRVYSPINNVHPCQASLSCLFSKRLWAIADAGSPFYDEKIRVFFTFIFSFTQLFPRRARKRLLNLTQYT
jgi:hypothetical protein